MLMTTMRLPAGARLARKCRHWNVAAACCEFEWGSFFFSKWGPFFDPKNAATLLSAQEAAAF